MARNCGECMINRVEIVELDPAGRCNRCGADYGPELSAAAAAAPAPRMGTAGNGRRPTTATRARGNQGGRLRTGRQK